MATVTVTASGTYKWSDTGVNTPWPSGSPPAGGSGGDDVVLNNSALVLNVAGTSCVAKSILVTAGTLGLDQTADNTLEVYNSITGANSANSIQNYDVSGVPQFTTMIKTNGANSATTLVGILINQGVGKLVGAPKNRWAKTTQALTGQNTSAKTTTPSGMWTTVDDATGWIVGDRIVFGTTQAYDITAVNTAAPHAAYADPLLTFTVSSTAHLVPGARVVLSAMQASLNGEWVVNTVPDGTTFTINVGTGFVLTDGNGTVTLMPKTDEVTIATITAIGGGVYGGTGAAEITWTDGKGASGSVAWDHAVGAPAGNFTSNLIIRPVDLQHTTAIVFTGSNNHATSVVTDVLVEGSTSASATGAVMHMQLGATTPTAISSNAFYNCNGGIGFQSSAMTTTTPTRSKNIFWSSTLSTLPCLGGAQTSTRDIGTESDALILRARRGIASNQPGAIYERAYVSGITSSASGSSSGSVLLGMFDSTFNDCEFYSNIRIVENVGNLTFGPVSFSRCGFGDAFSGAINSIVGDNAATTYANFTDCTFDTTGGTLFQSLAGLPSSSRYNVVNKNALVTSQEIYSPYGTITRYNGATNTNRSTSSIALSPIVTLKNLQYTVSIPCVDGATVRVVGYVKADTNFYNGGGANWTAPTVSLSGTIAGVVLTPDTFTATSAANNAFEQCDISITNTSGADGNVTLTFTANAKSVTTGTVYFDGMPTNSTFVTKARHYDFFIDQTQPNVVADAAISASEATALTYLTPVTGKISVTGGATQSDVALINDTTFQQLYDGTKAWACTTANLTSAIPCTSPLGGILIAAGDITTTGYTLNGSGSLAMGANTLTANDSFSYTYTGGTFSQATTVPTFAGGTLNIGEAGIYTFTQASGMTVSATPTSTANYNFGSGTFTGILTFHNNSAFNVIVEVPSGTSANSTGSPGPGTVTFSSPLEYQSVTVSGITTTSRLYIYDYSVAAPAGSRVLYNDVPGATSYTWTDAAAAVATRDIKIRIADVTGVTAKEFIEANIGTCATSGGGKDLTYLASQTSDTTYDANGVDGPAIYATSGITFTDAATDLVNINIAADTVALKTIYACFVHWLHTALGIDDDVAYINAPDPANYILTSMKIRNTSPDPLKITGGYFYDSTGSVENCVDDAGSTGNIYPMPVHVVAYQTTGTYAITGDIATVLAAIPSGTDNATAVLAAAQTTPIHADFRKAIGQAYHGDGSENDKLRSTLIA